MGYWAIQSSPVKAKIWIHRCVLTNRWLWNRIISYSSFPFHWVHWHDLWNYFSVSLSLFLLMDENMVVEVAGKSVSKIRLLVFYWWFVPMFSWLCRLRNLLFSFFQSFSLTMDENTTTSINNEGKCLMLWSNQLWYCCYYSAYSLMFIV